MGTTNKQLKSKRNWLESQKLSGSYYALDVDHRGAVSLSLADCYRKIDWTFGRPNSTRAVAKIKKLKALVDEMHAYLTDPDAPKVKNDW